MVKTTKNSETATPAVAPSVAPTPAPVPAPAKDEQKKKEKKTKKDAPAGAVTEKVEKTVVAPAPVVPAPVVDAQAPVEPETPATTDSSVVSKMVAFNAQLQQMTTLLQNIKAQYRSLEKGFNKELKAYYKASSRKHKQAGNRQPSGFVRPTLISNELAVFLGKPLGTEMARTEVSREINQYIRQNGLQDKENGRNINPDAKLSALLKLKEGDMLSYFNLQKYMKHHFVKSSA